MRKSIVSLAVAGMLGGGAFLAAAHATTPPPTYSSPCGASTDTGPWNGGSTPTVHLGPADGSASIGIIGDHGYLEAVGTQGPPPAGHISGATNDNSLYGSIGNDGSSTICVGSSAAGPGPIVQK